MTDRLTTEIIGFRQWIVGENLELMSAHVDDVWLPGVNTAKCHGRADAYAYDPRSLPTCKDCPTPDCHCGFYALHAPKFWYGPDRAKDSHNGGAIFPSYSFGPEPLTVAGLISAWGKTQVHHDGFRAQHAQVVALAAPERRRDAALARAIAADYGVPVVPQDELERVASEFGSLVPNEMRPAKRRPYDPYGSAGLFRHVYSQFVNSNAAAQRQSNLYSGYRVYTGNSMYAPPPPAPVKPKTPSKHHRVADAIAEMRGQQKYDPSEFVAKRKGGKR